MRCSAGDGRCAVTHEEGDEFSDLLGFGRPSERDPAERRHQLVERGVAGSITLVGDPFDEPLGCRRTDEAWCDAVDSDPEWCDLSGQAFAVGAERRLGGGIGKGAVAEGHLPLDRRDVHDGTATSLDHRGYERPVEADRGKQVQCKLGIPMLIVDRAEAARRGVRSAKDVHQDIETARSRHPGDDTRGALAGGEIRRDESLGIGVAVGQGPRGRPHNRSFSTELLSDGSPGPLGAGGHERSPPVQCTGAGRLHQPSSLTDC
jgi:hypothetical protein